MKTLGLRPILGSWVVDKLLWQGHKDFQKLLMLIDGRECEITVKPIESAYSKKLRGSSHLWFLLCARCLNAEGHHRIAKSKITGEPIELPWNETTFKAFYKDVLFEYTEKLSTEEQNGKEASEVANIVVRYWAERGTALPPWPSLESMSEQDLINRGVEDGRC